MNALYAIVFGACFVASSFRGVDLAPTDDPTTTIAAITDGSIPESTVLSVLASTQPPTVNAGSPEVASVSILTVPETEPATENIPSVVTTTPVPLMSTLPDEKSTAPPTKPSMDTTSISIPSTTAQPSHIMTIPSTTTIPKKPDPVHPDIIKDPGNLTTKAPTTTTSPEDKSSASLTKSSILLIVIPALYCLLH